MQAFVIAIIDVHIKLTRVNDRQLSFFLQEEFRLCRDFLYIRFFTLGVLSLSFFLIGDLQDLNEGS